MGCDFSQAIEEKMMKRLIVLTIALVVLLSAAPAFAQQASFLGGMALEGGEPSAAESEGDEEGGSDEDTAVEAEVEKERPFPFSGSISVGGSFGAASVLSDSEFTQTDSFSTSYSFGLGYKINDTFSLSTGVSYSKFLSDDGSIFIREGRLSDIGLGVGIKGWTDKEYTGIRIGPSLRFSFPTSDASITQRKIMGVSTGLGISRSFGGLSLSYSFGFSKNFHQYTSILSDVDETGALSREGGVEEFDLDGDGFAEFVAQPGVLTNFSLSNSFSLNFGFLEKFSAGLSLSYFDSFSYDNGTITSCDELTAENAVCGVGHSQGVSGSMRVGYRILPWLGSSLSASTSGQPLTNDQKSIRFPFWDLENGISSRTRISLGLSASY
jgi:hypothetical protein